MKPFLITIFLLSFVSANAQWTTIGPYGETVNDHLFIGSGIYIATQGGGIFKSSDKGQTWVPLSKGITDLTTQLLGYDGTYLYTISSGNKLFRSSNLGLNWLEMPLLSDPSSSLLGYNNVLYSAGSLGVYYSTDGGNSWKHTSIYTSTGYLNAGYLRRSGNNIYLTINSNSFGPFSRGVFRYNISTTKVDSILSVSNSDGIYELLASNDSLYLAASMWNGSNHIAGFFRSYNGGANWDSASTNIHNAIIQSIGLNGKYLFGGSNISGNRALLRCNLVNSTFDTVLNSTSGLGNLTDLISFGDTLIIPLGKLYQTTNHGNSWSTLSSSGITDCRLNCLLALNSDNILCGVGNTIYKSTDNGQSWNVSNINSYGGIWDIYSFNSTLFVGADGTGNDTCLYKSTDNGQTWKGVTLLNQYIYCLKNNGNNLFAGGSPYTYESTDGGSTWQHFDNGLPAGSVGNITFLGNFIYATMNAFNSSGSGVYRSSILSANWVQETNGWPSTIYPDIPFALEENGDILYASAYSNGVYTSSDSGNSWSPLNKGIEKRYVTKLLELWGDLFAATDSGVYVLYAESSSWRNITFNLPSPFINNISANNNYLFAADNSSSIWQIPLSMVETKSIAGASSSFHVFPNPASGTFNIKTNDLSGAEVNLIITNEYGEIIYNQKVSKNNTIKINTERWVNGIYFIQLNSNGSLATQKIVLNKI